MDAESGHRRALFGKAYRRRGPALLLVACCVLLACAGAGPALARHRHAAAGRGWTDGVVRCVAASAPFRRHAASRRSALPTDRAVFFTRSGDRCLWRHGATGRG